MSEPPLEAQLPRGQTVYTPIVRVHFDGSAEGGRGGGIATYGFVIEGEGFDHEESGLAVRPGSEHATNNVAEYAGAIHALDYLAGRGYRGHVLLMGDSQLVVRQITGDYEVRAEHLRQYHSHLLALTKRFAEVRTLWVPREENVRADALTKEAQARARAEMGRLRERLR